MKSRNLIALLLSVVVFGTSCAKKKSDSLNTRTLQQKKVALAEVRGPKDGITMVEVAVINEIIQNGRFTIIDKATVRNAISKYPAENDRQRLGKFLGVDYVLWVDISEFKITERAGFDAIEEEDSVMTEEQKSNKPIVSKRYKKVVENEGLIRLYWNFLNVETGEKIYKGMGEARESINSRDKSFTGKLALLERVTAQAVADFFSKIPN